MADKKFNVTKNLDNIDDQNVRNLIEEGSPEEIADFLEDTFNNAKVPPLRPEGFKTIIAELPREKEDGKD